VKKQQFILTGGGLVLLVLLFFFGRTIPKKSNGPAVPAANTAANGQTVNTNDLLAKAKQQLSTSQLAHVTQLENSVTRGDVKQQQINAYQQLAHFWNDSAHQHEIGLYYLAESAKLENSEKSLTFAAHLLLDDLMATNDPAMQNWMGLQAKALFEKSLELNPANDSSRVGLGACYMFGNVSDNPMEGILAVRKVAEQHPDNLYAQMMLGLGGVKSGQFDKAIERFLIVVNKQPDNLEAIFNLAETYERKGDKPNAIKWYSVAEKLIAVPEAKKEIADRIKTLQ
jgi:tetratricopeptide (TPR) repeat protein